MCIILRVLTSLNDISRLVGTVSPVDVKVEGTHRHRPQSRTPDSGGQSPQAMRSSRSARPSHVDVDLPPVLVNHWMFDRALRLDPTSWSRQ